MRRTIPSAAASASPLASTLRRLALAGAAAAAVSQLAGCGGANSAPVGPLPVQENIQTGPADARFWDAVPRRIPATAQRGDILQIQERNDAPAGAKGYNIIYVSEGADGKLAYVSGMVFYPTAAAAGTTRPVMLWNHETSGSGDVCAPSRNGVALSWTPERIHGLSDYLAKGYVVVASDYPGFGTPGATVYMQGQPQAKSSLDIVLAAQRLAGTQAGNQVAMAGWSQGGQTSLWAASIAPTYAPNLQIVGAALLAPAARTLELVEYEAANTSYGAYYMAIHAGMQAGHPDLNLKDVITVDGLELLPHLAYDCFSLWSEVARKKPVVAKLEGLAPGTPWRAAHEANQAFLPIQPRIPFVVFQGTADPDVPLDMTRKLVKDMCASGSTDVEMRELPNGDHDTAFMETVPAVVKWVEERFKGMATTPNCAG